MSTKSENDDQYALLGDQDRITRDDAMMRIDLLEASDLSGVCEDDVSPVIQVFHTAQKRLLAKVSVLDQRAVFAYTIDFDKKVRSIMSRLRKQPVQKSPIVNSHKLSLVVAPKQECAVCVEVGHTIDSCSSFLKQSATNRLQLVNKMKLCILCLGPSHSVNRCMYNIKCKECTSSHHTLLHFDEVVPEVVPEIVPEVVPKVVPVVPQPSPLQLALVAHVPHSEVLFPTATVIVKNRLNKFDRVRILIDSASSCSYITKACAQRLGLKIKYCTQSVNGLGQLSSDILGSVHCEVTPTSRDSYHKLSLEASVLPTICSVMPAGEIDFSLWHHIKGLDLADPGFSKPALVDMLISVNVFTSALLPGFEKGRHGQPIAIPTTFGWILMGECMVAADPSRLFALNLSRDSSTKRFWELEIVDPPKPVALSKEELACKNNSGSTCRRTPQGRLLVPLSFSDSQSKPLLSSSKQIAPTHPQFKAGRSKLKTDYLQIGHMEEVVPPSSNVGHFNYIPHQGTLRPGFATPSLRTVFDVARTTDGDTFHGLLPANLVPCTAWWSGPIRLFLPKDDWLQSSRLNDGSALEELKILSLGTANNAAVVEGFSNQFSSYEQIVNDLAHYFRNPSTRVISHLLCAETYSVTEIVVEHVLEGTLASEFRAITEDAPFSLSKATRRLCPPFDTGGLLKVAGHIPPIQLAYERKHASLSPRTHHRTLLITEERLRTLHSGSQTLQLLFASDWWILLPERSIRSMLSSCVERFGANSRPLVSPRIGELPLHCSSQLKPFSSAPVGYAGPSDISYGRGRHTYQGFVCIVVCTVTATVHLELVSELIFEAYRARLWRFMAHRGRRFRLVSDRGKTFMITSELLTKSSQAMQTKQVFVFNPPGSPHFSGLAEAGETLKTYPVRVVGLQCLTYVEVNKLLKSIVLLLCLKPLFPPSSDPNDLAVHHFIYYV